MINTSAKEGLPNSFIEAAANRCAILSFIDSDSFASEYGYHADDEDFQKGLRYLLENNRWRELGEKGYRYIQETYETQKAIQQHLEIYRSIIK